MFIKIFPEKEEFKRLAEEYNLIPVWTEIPGDLETPISLFYKFFEIYQDYIFLLESVEGGEKWARYSFIGFDPFLIFKSKEKNVEIFDKLQGKTNSLSSHYPLNELKRLVSVFKTFQDPELPRFWGGAVGYVSYEVVNFFEPRVKRGKDVLNFFDLHFIFPSVLLAYDRFRHAIKIITLCLINNSEGGDLDRIYKSAEEKIKKILSLIKGSPIRPPLLKKELLFHPEIEKETFLGMVKRAKEYIFEGDIIQVVLSQRFFVEEEILLNPHAGFYIYRALRKINPSPYMFYLKFGEEVLIGASPEILVRQEKGIVETRPIAGTRRRGKNEEEDRFLEEDLKRDEKELAEHIMLVDLGRNDVGRVCEFGSVEVYELMVVERYSHVMHLVSGVKGRLMPGKDMFETFSALFPAGTVSGAPKIRAMEIIEELEKTVRGPYAGAVGYFGFLENMDFCITLRTLFQKGKKLYLQAGAGIVADSVPEREFEETINKAKALEKAVELFGRGYFL